MSNSSSETSSPAATYVRKGFGLKAEVQDTLAADYTGHLVDLLRARDYSLNVGETTIRLAREFGFCYGVERAVDYAYQTRIKFPDKRIFLAGEIIHNPHVNAKLREMGVVFLSASGKGFDYSPVEAPDVVILPAFGVTIQDFQTLRDLGCVIVDTTCGSVLNVWKRVEVYARDGYTSLIHGKYYHEETRATASQVEKYPNGQYLVVRDMAEADMVMDYIEAKAGLTPPRTPLSREAFLEKFSVGASDGFDPDLHLDRIGVANQTTMLARESLAIGAAVGEAMARAYGESHKAEHFRTFDTICSATQDRQDAVMELMREPMDLMVVVGGYNSSNTISLAALCAEQVPTYHIADPDDILVEDNAVRFRRIAKHHVEDTMAPWLPTNGPLRVGITAGASTPNNKIGQAVARVFAIRGIDPASVV
ncbi:4-hydroxy-3-methylbut-2-enyl diphosphate reductase [Gemmatimonas phototrophica]|uniref:4-hydroxy-3-methylbut-2-enyl diphosphate reductase n=1 Tax=Gemmatimonas phototrophica TaxID=1379270 RepID=A0A143BMJ2_9BACT|nr:4-hydroxy-3-methylbut-2-enyl diphosphate reductase [Gemmatimonas phototrophica]AMW05681.1 4-hydroxy-3-methylbut-2-enyl diphosphate reductase [Gemmatimonas phototrophica]